MARAGRLKGDFTFDRLFGLNHLGYLAHVHVMVPLLVAQIPASLPNDIGESHSPNLKQAPIGVEKMAFPVEHIHEIRCR